MMNDLYTDFNLGTYYYYLPWAARKPIVCVTSQWEDVGFRYHSLNVLLRIASGLVSVYDIIDEELKEEI